MSFNIIDYIDSVKESMDDNPLKNKIFFAAWCTEGLFHQNFDFMLLTLGSSKFKTIQSILEKIWTFCIDNYDGFQEEQVDTWIKEISFVLNESNLDWESYFDDSRQQYKHFSTIKFFECLLMTLKTYLIDNGELPATCAEFYITSIDFKLSMVLGIEDLSEPEEIKLEVGYQQQMLKFLEKSPTLTADCRFSIRPENIDYKQQRKLWNQ